MLSLTGQARWAGPDGTDLALPPPISHRWVHGFCTTELDGTDQQY
jgi:hypothetical protein